jgi:uncharacterized protein GlcG (DUF336 family)
MDNSFCKYHLQNICLVRHGGAHVGGLGVSGQHGLHCKTLAKKKHQEQKQL